MPLSVHSTDSCHVRDLTEKEDAVDPSDWKNLKWEFSSKGKKVMRELRKLCKESDSLYLATDPDREGEAIAWHIHNDFEEKKLLEGLEVHRITFNEITSSAVENAVKSPRSIDYHLVNAYLARRILDHLIGFNFIAVDKPAGPAPTTTTSYSIDSLSVFSIFKNIYLY